MRIAGEPAVDLAAEVVQIVLVEPALEKARA